MKTIKSIVKEVLNLYSLIFVSNEEGIMSEKVMTILSNPQDKQIYLKAIKKLQEEANKNPGKENQETIQLSTKEELTLTV